MPADRYGTASQFIEALEHEEGTEAPVSLPSGRWVRWLAAVIGVAAMFAIALAVRRELSGPGPSSGLDTTRYAILPFEYGANAGLALNERQLLQDALSRWSGIEVVPPFQLKDALARKDSSLSPSDARDVARDVGAGRYIRGEITRLGDSVRINAQLYGSASGRNNFV